MNSHAGGDAQYAAASRKGVVDSKGRNMPRTPNPTQIVPPVISKKFLNFSFFRFVF